MHAHMRLTVCAAHVAERVLWCVACVQAVAAIPAKLRLLLSGTPIQNKLTEFYALLNVAMPGLLGEVRATPAGGMPCCCKRTIQLLMSSSPRKHRSCMNRCSRPTPA